MRYYNIDKNEVLKMLKTSVKGLSSKEVKEKQNKEGINELALKHKKSKAAVFLEQFQDVLVIILIISAIISIFTKALESAIVIFTVISLNAIIGTIQYFKAEKTLDSLKTISSPTVRVIRDDKEVIVHSKELVVGDIVIINSGDVICSDGRIIEASNLEINESSITGESVNVEKSSITLENNDLVISDQVNMLFSSSKVVKGKGMYVVTNIGMNTEIGKIFNYVNKERDIKSPLQKSLDEFSKYLAILIIVICLVVFIINLYRHISFIDSLMFSVSLAVAAIPEALGAIVTIVLALSTKELASKNAIMKDIRAVETLGAVSVICSDKTGTITKNELQIQSIYNNFEIVNANKLRLDGPLLNCLVYCNSIENRYVEDQIEKNIYSLCLNKGYEITSLKQKKDIAYLQFDSNRKMMSSLVDGYLYVKGAAEIILAKSNYYYFSNMIIKLDGYKKAEISRVLKDYTNNGLRVIGLGYKKHIKKHLDYLDEDDFVFLGLIAFVDPPRDDVNTAIKMCKEAHVDVVMITGDNLETSKYIAKSIGIDCNDDEAITGSILSSLTDEEFEKTVEKIKVYARVTPEDKIRIVEGLQKKNKIVAMTGDGINDAPALKKANVGVAMGKGGTEVAKDASSVILTDDNFYTIINAVGIGRKVFANIQNAIRFLLAGNGAAIIVVFITSILMLPIPFAPVHLLFINLITDSLPAISIGMEETDSDYLTRKPRSIKSKILSKKIAIKTIIEGILISLVVLIGYFLGLNKDQYYARTFAFLTLSLTRLIYSLNCRKDKTIFVQKANNKMLNISIIVGIAMIVMVSFIPIMQGIFLVSKLSIIDFLIILALSLTPTLIIQIYMLIKNHSKK